MKKYFAYGSNMHLYRLRRWGVEVKNPVKGILKDYELQFNVQDDIIPEYAYANIVPCKGSDVEGIIFETDLNSFIILDEYEGYPEFYDKLLLDVITENSSIACICYTGTSQHCCTNLRPSQEHFEHVLKGKPFLSTAYYNKLFDYYKKLYP